MTEFNFNLNKLITNYISRWNSFPNLFPNYTAISVNRYIIKNNILIIIFNTILLNSFILLFCQILFNVNKLLKIKKQVIHYYKIR